MQSRSQSHYGVVTILAFFCLFFPIHAQAQVHVTTQHSDNARTGQNIQETILTPANVNQNSFGKVFSVPVDGFMYAQPLYLSNVSIANGIHNVVYAATEHDSVYAVDADDGTVYWHVSFINPAAGITTPSNTDVNCGDLRPEIGITGTPVIDTSSGTIYMVAKTKENGTYVQRLHALDVSTGAERPGSPVLIAATVPGTGDGSVNGTLSFNALRHMNRPGLLLQNGHVIIAWASHCDVGPYHGWVMSYNASSLAQEAVFNTSPTGGLAGIWMSGAGLAGDSAFNTYFATGNGSYDGNPNFGDSVVKLGPPSGTFPLGDWFTPFNQASLNSADVDLGSGGVLLLPDQPVGSPHERLLAMVGKEGKLYLIDRDNMGHFRAGNDGQIVQSFGVAPGMWGMPAWWNNRLYLAGAADVGGATGPLKVFQFNPATGLFSTSPSSFTSLDFSYPAPTPAVSANGTGNGIVWVIQVNQFSGTLPAVLRAYDANNLAVELYNSEQNTSRDYAGPAVKFTVPTVVNGKVYVGTQTQLSAYGLLSPLGALSLNPASLAGGLTSTGTLTLIGPAPAGGLTVSLSSDNTAVATVPASVTIPQGATSFNFNVNTSAVASATPVMIRATYSTTVRTTTLTVQPWLLSVALNPVSVVGGNPSTGTVTLSSPAPAGNLVVALESSNPSAATVSVSATVLAGMTTVNFPVTTLPVSAQTPVTITGTYQVSRNAALAVFAAPTVTSVTLSPGSVTGGATSNGTVTLNAAAPAGGVLVTLASSNPAVATVPASVTVAANTSTATFTVNTQPVAGVTPVTITATHNGSANGNLSVNPPSSFNPIRVNSAGSAYTDPQGRVWSADTGFSGGTVATVSGRAIANTVDDVLYQSERWGPFTYTFTVPAGSYLVTLKFAETAFTSGAASGQRVFNVAINGTTVLTNFDIKATAGGANIAVDRTFAVNAGGGSNNLVIQFIHVAGQPDDPKVDAIEIVSGVVSGPGISTQPANQTVTAGQAATFTVVASGTAPLSYQWRKNGANIGGATSASYTTPATVIGDNGSVFDVVVSNAGGTIASTTATLTVNALAVTGLGLNPATVTGGTNSIGTVTLNGPAPAGGAVVALSSSMTSAATVPETVTVPATATSTTFTVTTFAGSAQETPIITATLNGSVNAPLVVNAPAILSITLSPTSVIGGTQSTGTITLNGPAPPVLRGIAVSLTSSNLAVATVPTVVSVPADATTTTFQIDTLVVAAQGSSIITAILNGAVGALLTVHPAPSVSSVTLSPGSVTGGATSNGTVTLNAAAPAGGVLVTLASSNPAVATVPASVTVAANTSTATFTVNTQPVAGVTPVTITATHNGSANGNLSVNPPSSFNPIRVNSAGSAYTDPQGRVWSADTGFSGGTVATVSGRAIANTVDDVLYQSERWGPFTYTFTVPAGSYLVTLKFAETAFTSGAASGQRVFNVAINGTTVLTNFDIKATAGGANIAVDRTFAVNAGGGSNNLVIQFIHVAGQPDDPKVDAIEIVSGVVSGPGISTQPANQTVTAGQAATFTVVASGTAPLSYQWRKNSANISGATSASYTTPATVIGDNGSVFDVVVSNAGGTIASTTATLTVAVSLPTLNAVALNPTSVIGGNASTGTVTLSAAAPAAGMVVALSDNSSAATTPTSVTIPGGMVTATFTIATTPVASNTSVQISAVLNGTTRTVTLTVNRPALLSVSVTPASVKGGTPSTGTVTLNGAAPTNGRVVSLSENRSFTSVPSSVTVPANATSATFTITTTTITTTQTATISGTLNGTTRSATLTVTP